MGDSQAGSAGLKVIVFFARVVMAILIFACIVLAFGFALLLFGADPDVGFAHFVYESAARFMDPFRGLVEPTELDGGGLVAWSALFAIAAYLVLIWLMGLVVSWARGGIYRRQRATSIATSAATAASAVAPQEPADAPSTSSEPEAQSAAPSEAEPISADTEVDAGVSDEVKIPGAPAEEPPDH